MPYLYFILTALMLLTLVVLQSTKLVWVDHKHDKKMKPMQQGKAFVNLKWHGNTKAHFEVENWSQPFTIAQGSFMENYHLKTVAWST